MLLAGHGASGLTLFLAFVFGGEAWNLVFGGSCTMMDSVGH
jgi:hypothetical protein